jgi:AdoMet-dependent rRNA methyltransferase SPB1
MLLMYLCDSYTLPFVCRKELKTAKADLVLHDGAPNVGKNWIHDAYQQSLLTLHAFKLATEFLCKGGWFVTKVFRSKDYQSLIWVFGQFFKKVHATKPAASRNESAEIFVVCQYYLAPDKIDPKFLDPRHVFSDVEVEDKKAGRELINPERKKKPGSLGYGDGVTMLYKEATASDFILGANHIQILNECNAIRLDTERVENHPRTTKEIRECIKDLKVLGMKELRLLKKWRDALKKEFEAADNPAEEEEVVAVEKTADEVK